MGKRISDVEKMSREDLGQLQMERLQAVVNRAYRRVTHYREILDDAGVDPSQIGSMADLQRIPFTTSKTLQENYPYGMFAVPLREVIRLQPTTAISTGPIVLGYTHNDIQHWTELTARTLAFAGCDEDDVIQICLDYGLFPGALGLHYGAEMIGASVIPSCAMGPEQQIEVMRNYRATVIATTPGHALHMSRFLREQGIDPKSLFLRLAILVGETWTERMRRKIQDGLCVSASGSYGLNEMFVPGIASECEHKSGLHINEDHFLAEIVDPATGKVLGPDQEGELVVTTLTREAFPLLRYRTGDITAIKSEVCPCGRMLRLMENMAGRTDDLVIIEGVRLSPSMVGQLLKDLDLAHSNYQLVISSSEAVDQLEVRVEVTMELFQDEVKKLEDVRKRIEGELLHRLRIPAMVRLVEEDSLKEAPRVIDKRER